MDVNDIGNAGVQWLLSEAQSATQDDLSPVITYLKIASSLSLKGELSPDNQHEYDSILDDIFSNPDRTPFSVIIKAKRGRRPIGRGALRREKVLAMFVYCFNQQNKKKYPLSQSSKKGVATNAFQAGADKFNSERVVSRSLLESSILKDGSYLIENVNLMDDDKYFMEATTTHAQRAYENHKSEIKKVYKQFLKEKNTL